MKILSREVEWILEMGDDFHQVVKRRLCREVVLVACEMASLSHVALEENRCCIDRGDRKDWEA